MENTKPQEQTPEQKKPGEQPVDHNTPHNYLTKKDIPDSTNQSTGIPGSGQRQDTN